MDYKTIIPKRKAVRDYKKTEVDSKVLKELVKFYESDKGLIDNIGIDVLIRDKDEVYDMLKGAAGYNDFMLEAPHYIFILSEDKENSVENTGYLGEHMMLKAFELGVGSCWITFKDGEDLKKRLNLSTDKKLTGLISLGYDDNKSKIVNDNVSGYNPSKADINVVEDNVSQRMPLEEIVYVNSWGNNTNLDELNDLGLLEAFQYTRFAPSTKNKQPWRFIVDKGLIVLTIAAGESEYEEKIDTGVVMLYFETIVDTTLYDMTWRLGKPEKDYDIPKDYKIVGYCTV
jgi:nitroreductase